jgi:type II secretory pathway component GspD/PulD (secretin)
MSNSSFIAAVLSVVLATMSLGSILNAQGPAPVARTPSAKEIKEADDLYLRGAQQFGRKRFEAAEHLFQRAAELNPNEPNYVLSLLLAREAQAHSLVRQAEDATLRGDHERANDLLRKAHALDPNGPYASQHLEARTIPAAPRRKLSFESPIALLPDIGKHSFHLRGDLHSIISRVYGDFGISVTFDPSVQPGTEVTLNVDDIDFAEAAKILDKMSGTFGVPLQPRAALIAKHSEDRRESLAPWVQATIYMPGQSQAQLFDLANLARIVFGLRQVAVSIANDALILRGDERTVRLACATYADMVDSQPDVLLDVNVYEVDGSRAQNIGFQPPSTLTAIDVSNAAQKLIANNQTLLNESISSGALTLSGSSYAQELEEVEYLVAAGVSGSSEFTGIIGTIGSYQGVPVAGVSVGSTALNLLLTINETRTLDAMQIRAANGETSTFRVGSRYPILTAVSTASTSNSALISELEAAGVSSATIAKYTGSGNSTTTIPQIQFEDLGITLKVTPQAVGESDVRLKIDLKIEALDGTGIDNIPILDNYSLVSVVQVTAGEPAMLATLISSNQIKSLDGIPDLNDLPGFQSTNTNTNGTRNELLITVTPHIVSGMQ